MRLSENNGLLIELLENRDHPLEKTTKTDKLKNSPKRRRFTVFYYHHSLKRRRVNVILLLLLPEDKTKNFLYNDLVQCFVKELNSRDTSSFNAI